MNLFTEPAAQIIVAIIPIVGIVFGGIVIFFYLLWRHREVQLQIRSGVYKPSSFNFPIFALLAGLLLSGIGFILFLLFLFIDGVTYSLLGGLIPLVVGICLLIFYKLVKNKDILK